MVDGIDCAMCADAHLPSNLHSELIAELPGSYERLASNQTKAGYAAFIAKRHAAELLTCRLRSCGCSGFDLSTVAQTVSTLFAPMKIDYLVMGHLCPHVHCHVYPQYENDDPHGLLNPKDGDVRLGESDWKARLDAMRRELERRHPTTSEPK